MKIVLASESAEYTAGWLNIIQARFPQLKAFIYQEGHSQPDPDITLAIAWKPPASLFANYPGLQYLFNMGAGVDAIMAQNSLPASVQIVRLEDAGMADQMLAYVIHYVTKITRSFDSYAAFQQKQQWKPLPDTSTQGHTLGVMGLGVIGRRIASGLSQLGYTVNGWSRTGREVAGVQVFAGEQGLTGFLQNTRLLVNVLPLTPQTQGILNWQNLSLLQPGASLISIGRGAHLVEEDLLSLMKTGHISYAVLDVFRQEPLPQGHPFWQHPNITVTPHISGLTNDSQALQQIAAKIALFEKGQAISGIVSNINGY